MYEPARHVPLRADPWDPAAAELAVREIVEDALARFDPERFWPAHPLDDGVADGATTLYFGAAGAMWALAYLRAGHDFAPVLPHLLSANHAEYAAMGWYPGHASLLMGEVGVLLLTMRLAPEAAVADGLYARIAANLELPVLELMWGTPGTMLAARFMAEITGEDRWRAPYLGQAQRLLAELEETEIGPLWTQHLYSRSCRYLGPVHGFAGNMQALFAGWDLLDDGQRARVADAVARTLAATARESAMGVNWPAIAGDAHPRLVQYCHGAPGIVTTFAASPVRAPELDRLLRRAGELIWAAGPLAKGSNLCHGDGRKRLRLPAAVPAFRRAAVARACPRLRDDRDRPVPRRAPALPSRTLHAVDGRSRSRRVSARLPLGRAPLPDRGRVLISRHAAAAGCCR